MCILFWMTQMQSCAVWDDPSGHAAGIACQTASTVNTVSSLVPRLSCGGGGKREPGTHCSRMRQVPLVTCILLRCTKITVNSAYLLKGHTAWLYSFWDSYGRFLSQKQYRFAGDSLHCFVRRDRWTSKEKIASGSHVLQCLAGIHERVDNSCTRRAECPRRSFVIVHTEHGQGQAPFMREKSAYLAEVGVTEQILRIFSNSQKSWGNWACANSVYQALFSPPTH